MNKITVLIFLAIPLVIIIAQTSGQENPNTETKGAAANNIDTTKNAPSNETDIAAQQSAQNGNPSAKLPEEANTKPEMKKPKPKPKPKRKPRRRKPRWRKRPRRPRKPRPTPKAQAKAKPNMKPKEKKHDGSKIKQSEPNIQTEINLKDTIQEKLKPSIKVNEKQTQVKDTKTIEEMKTQDTIQTKPNKDNILAQKDPVSSTDVKPMIEPQAQIQPEPIVKSMPKVSETKTIKDIKVQHDMPIADKKAETVNKPNPVNEPKPAKKDGSIGKPKANKKAKENRADAEGKPKKGGVFADLDSYFEQFDDHVVTEATLVAPPKFDPNAPPGEKVIPKMDRDKGVAYDGTRKLTRQFDEVFYIEYPWLGDSSCINLLK